MVRARIRLIAGLAALVLAGCAEHAPPAEHAAAPERPKVTVDADATVHIPPIVVPASGFVSAEAKAQLHDIMTHPYPPIPKAGDPLEAYQKGREALNRDVYAPMIARDKEKYAVKLQAQTIAGVYVDREIARKFLDAGIQDSKRIGSDMKIRSLAEIIRKTPGAIGDTVAIGPERYNDLYEKFGNLNTLLGWGHARVIENLLAKKPACPRSLSDQFADARVINASLLKHGRKITIEQRPRAESDIAVAAASIIAREAFINWLERKSKELG